MSESRKRILFSCGGLLLFFVVWGGVIAWPLLHWLMEGQSISWSTAFSLDAPVWEIARITLYQASLSTAGSALLGVPLGLWVGGLQSRWGELGLLKVAKGAFRFPFIAPGSAAATAYLSLIGTQGLLTGTLWPETWTYSFQALVFSHIAINFTWVALQVAEERAQISERLLESARVLGAGSLKRIWMVWLPELAPVLVSCLIFVFQLCVVSFSLVLLMGGGPPVETLETSIFSQIQITGGDWQGAFPFGVTQLGITLLPVVIVNFLAHTVFKRQTQRTKVRSVQRRLKPSTRSSLNSLEVGFAGVIAFLVGVLPYFLMGSEASWGALGDSEFALAWNRSMTLLGISLPVGLFLGVLSSALAAEGSRSKRIWGRVAFFLLEGCVSITPGVSAMVLSLAFWRAWGHWVDPFSGSLSAIALIQGVGVYPLIHRAMFPVFSSPQQREQEAARVLGVSSWGAWWVVEWPRLLPVWASVTGLAAGLLLGEVSSVSFFKGEGGVTLPLLIGQWIRQYRFEEAITAAVALMGFGAFWVWVVPILLNRMGRLRQG